MSDIPQPDDTGSAGTQTIATQQELLPTSSYRKRGGSYKKRDRDLAAFKKNYQNLRQKLRFSQNVYVPMPEDDTSKT